MIDENSCPSEKYVYRGTLHFAGIYDFLYPNIYSETAEGDRGAFVFAGLDRAHALAYVLKDHMRTSSIVLKQHGDVGVSEIVCCLPVGMTFADLYDKKGYLQTLPSRSFKAVVHDKGYPPGEWITRRPVRVYDYQEFSLFDAVRLGGVQVFSVHPDVRYKKIRFDFEPDPFDPLRRTASSNGKPLLRRAVHFHSIRYDLCKAGLLVWENLRPELRDTIPLVADYVDLRRHLEGPLRPAPVLSLSR